MKGKPSALLQKTEIQAGLEYNEDFFLGMTVADMTAMKNLLADSSLDEDHP